MKFLSQNLREKKLSGALHEETFRREETFYQSYGGKEGVLKKP